MRRRHHGHLVLAALSSLLAAGLGSAPCAAGERFGGTLAVTTDYVLRGVSQTAGGAAVQAGASYRDETGWFLGAWASNVEAHPRRERATETNFYAGYGFRVSSEWNARVSYTRYLYVDDPRPVSYDYGEVALTVGYQDWLAATLSFQPDSKRFAASGYGYADNEPAAGYEVSVRWPLRGALALTAGAGYYDLTRLFGVGYWSGNAGLSYVRGPLQLDVTLFSTDATGRRLFGDTAADGRWVATVVWHF
jgi:uncharacterized protein (TIGR02001 family)